MYNGIGLQTPRGSGTNGYIQTSKFFLKPKQSSNPSSFSFSSINSKQTISDSVRKPNKEILDHDRKRQIEVKLLVLRETLADQGYTDVEIEERVGEKRKELEAAETFEEGEIVVASSTVVRKSEITHHDAARKEKQLEMLKDAFAVLDRKRGHRRGGQESKEDQVKAAEFEDQEIEQQKKPDENEYDLRKHRDRKEIDEKHGRRREQQEKKEGQLKAWEFEDSKMEKKKKPDVKEHDKKNQSAHKEIDEPRGYSRDKSKRKYEARSDSESSGQYRRRIDKKHNRRRAVNSESDSEADVYKKSRKRMHEKDGKHKKSRPRDDSLEYDGKSRDNMKRRYHRSSDSESSGQYNGADTKKHKRSGIGQSDSDSEAAIHKSSSKRKHEKEAKHKRSWHSYDSSDSDSDSGKEYTKRKRVKSAKKSRRHDSDSD